MLCSSYVVDFFFFFCCFLNFSFVGWVFSIVNEWICCVLRTGLTYLWRLLFSFPDFSFGLEWMTLKWLCFDSTRFCIHRIPAHLVYPQAFVQPSVVIPHVQPSAATATAAAAAAATSPYLDYTGATYAQYSAAAATAAAAAAAYEQYPYAASPAPTSYMTTAGYGYAVQQPLATAATPGAAAAAAAAFSQYQPQQLQTDRMQ